jgi:hypothetical protein
LLDYSLWKGSPSKVAKRVVGVMSVSGKKVEAFYTSYGTKGLGQITGDNLLRSKE